LLSQQNLYAFEKFTILTLGTIGTVCSEWMPTR